MFFAVNFVQIAALNTEIVSYLIFLVYVFAGFKDSIKRKFFVYGSSLIIIGTLFWLIQTILNFMAEPKTAFPLNIINSSKKYLTAILVCLVVLLIKNFKEFVFNPRNPYRMSVIIIISISIVFLCGLVVLYSKTDYSAESFELLLTIVYIGVLVIIGAVMHLYSKIYLRLQNEYRLEMSYERAKLSEDYNEKLLSSKRELKLLRHDFTDQLRMVEGFLNQGMYDRAHGFLHTLYEPVARANSIVITGNPVIDIILNNKNEKCRADGIQLNIQAGVQEIWLGDFEISTIFNNILNNAMEAVLKLGEGQERYIDISIESRKNYFRLICSNPFAEPPVQKGKQFFTIKKDKENHGLGISSIESALEKYKLKSKEAEVIGDTFNITIEIFPNEN